MPDASEKKYFTSKGVEVQLCTRRIADDPNCSDVWDAEGHIFCGHGWEVCELCGTDHRPSNVIKDWNGADVDYITDWSFKRNDAEMKVLTRWHLEGGGGPNMVIGTEHTHALRERLQNSPDILATLPKWPPPIKPFSEIQLRNLVKKPELNGKRGIVKRWSKKKHQYVVAIEDYLDGQEFLVHECHIRVMRMR